MACWLSVEILIGTRQEQGVKLLMTTAGITLCSKSSRVGSVWGG